VRRRRPVRCAPADARHLPAIDARAAAELRDEMERSRGGRWRDSQHLLDGEVVIRDPRLD